MTSVFLVEDHAIMAKAITRLLENRSSANVVAVATSAEAAAEQLPGLNVDVVLVDVSLPQMNGIEFVEQIHQTYPDLPCMMLSGHRSSQYVNRSLAVGARGYVLKEDVEGILEGIPCILDGEVYISRELRTPGGGSDD